MKSKRDNIHNILHPFDNQTYKEEDLKGYGNDSRNEVPLGGFITINKRVEVNSTL